MDRANNVLAVLTRWLVLLTVLMVVVPAFSQELPPSLRNVPQSAPLVLYVPNMAGLSQDLAQLDQVVGLNVPVLADLLAFAKQMSGLTMGVDDQGALLAIVTDAAALTGEMVEPPVVLLVPILNYQEFLQNFNAQPSEGTVQVTMPDGRAGWLKAVGPVAVLGASQATVEAFDGGAGQTQWLTEAVGPQAVEYLKTADVALIANVQAAEAALAPAVENLIAQADTMLRMAMAMNPSMAGDPGILDGLVEAYGDALRAWVRDTSAAVIMADLQGGGIGLTITSRFEPGSALAQHFSRPVQDSADILNRLPNQDYLFAVAMDYEGLGIADLVRGFADRMRAQQPESWLVRMLDATQGMLSHTKRNAGMFSLQPAMGPMPFMGGNPFVGLGVVQTDDPQAYLASMKQYYESMAQLSAGPTIASTQPGGATQPQATLFSGEYEQNALELDGISVDRYGMRPNVAASPGAPAGMAVPAQEGYLAAVEQYVLMTVTPDIELLRQGLAAVKQTDGLGNDPGIQAVRRDGLPDQLAAEVYLNTRTVGNTINGVLAMMMGQSVAVPEQLEPIGAGLAVKDGSATARLYVPMSVIQFSGQVFTQMMMLRNPMEEAPPTDGAPGDDGGLEQPEEPSPAAPF